jgi:hypothetical protein
MSPHRPGRTTKPAPESQTLSIRRHYVTAVVEVWHPAAKQQFLVMPVSVATPSANFARHVFGAAALAFGLIMLAWPTITAGIYRVTLATRRRCRDLRRSCDSVPSPRKGAQSSLVRFILSSPYCACHKSSPKPQIYNSWGNFFEQFSLVTGAAIVYARLSSPWSRETLNRIGRIWAVTTTVLFELAAAALLTNRMALLATRLLTMMLVIFGLLVWIPLFLSAPTII